MGELNQTLFIGPEAPSAVADLLESFDTSQIEDLSDVYDYFAGILDAFSGIAEAYDNASRTPSSVAPQQGFVCATNGDLLFYDEGFPDVLGDCSLCVSPILILHHDVVSGAWGLHTAAMVKE
jgi:hypothetical protein